MDNQNISFDEIFNKVRENEFVDSLEEDVIVAEQKYIDGIAIRATVPEIRVDAVIVFFCCQGSVLFTVDYKTYNLTAGMGIVLISRNVVGEIQRSDNYIGYALIISKQFMISLVDEIPSLMAKATKTGLAGNDIQFEADEMKIITTNIERIRRQLKTTDNVFREYIVKNEVSNFFMELVYFMLKKGTDENSAGKTNQTDAVIRKFLQLLLQNFKKQHEVIFYAQELCMTHGNLTRIITHASGKSPLKWIHDALLAEAKTLLRKPDVSTQQIAEELHFSDQSSFSKFFKKHTKMTPTEFRRKRY
ncbi:MAG: AraC family transcriptional regulator [Tannerellaceae bacterium]|nr:AraC family transcriptional regulator [Tannerellaceae bacterium]